MHKSVSIYLDLVRFIAALLVFFYHAKYSRFDGGWLTEVGQYGHDAVMIFFVLSGFVITYVAATKETELRDFAVSRLSRLYSVVLPALLLTLFFDFLGKSLDPSLYQGVHYESTQPTLRFVLNLFFLNEVWFSSWRPFSNGPFWSICFEFWYYVIFAICVFLKGSTRLVMLIFAALICGPKVLLLMPVWLCGVLVYKRMNSIEPSIYVTLFLFIFPILLYVTYINSALPELIWKETKNLIGRDFLLNELKWSKRFVHDYLVGVLFSVHLLGAIHLVKRISIGVTTEALIRYFANIAFSLYLLHYPILQFFGSFLHNGTLITGLTFLLVLVLAPATEGKKDLWKAMFVYVTAHPNKR